LLGIADDLHQAFAVAQVDEDDAAVVAATVHPAAQADGLAEQCLIGEAAVVGSHGHVGYQSKIKIGVIGCRSVACDAGSRRARNDVYFSACFSFAAGIACSGATTPI